MLEGGRRRAPRSRASEQPQPQPQHDDDVWLQQRQWHFQETPPAQIQHRRLPYAAAAAAGDALATPEPSAKRALASDESGGRSHAQSAAEFARSQFRRRNRLEQRLEELQKDVASLTLKLRASSNRSNSTARDPQQTPPLAGAPLSSANGYRGGPREQRSHSRRQQQETRETTQLPSPVVKIRKQQRTRSNISEHSTTPTQGRILSHTSVSTMRELHKVTTERDQLRFELEKTKRTLASTERKYEEAVKAREALERLKAHCESLQESLDLSEKIRVRQKKLLQQLQLNHQTLGRLAAPPQISRETSRFAAAAVASAASAPARGTRKRVPVTATSHGGVRTSAHDDSHSRRSSRRRLYDDDDDDSEDDGVLDSLVNRSAADARGRRAPVSVPAPAAQRVSHSSVGARMKRQASHFLAPTQASLQRVQARRPEEPRRPFL